LRLYIQKNHIRIFTETLKQQYFRQFSINYTEQKVVQKNISKANKVNTLNQSINVTKIKLTTSYLYFKLYIVLLNKFSVTKPRINLSSIKINYKKVRREVN